MQKKWGDLFQVLLGTACSAAVWLVLRHQSKERNRKRKAKITGSPGTQNKRAAKPAKRDQSVAIKASGGPSDLGPLYQATQNELIVHQMLLAGDSELKFRDFAPSPLQGRGGSEAGGDDGGEQLDPMVGAARAVQAAAEGAFFSVLREALAQDPPQLDRLAALVLDARDQLAQLVPKATPEGQALLAGMKEKLDMQYVSQRLSQGYDAAYLGQLFDYLLHVVAQLQAPARRASTQARYQEVTTQFAAAAAAAAGARAQAAAEAAAGAAGVDSAGPITAAAGNSGSVPAAVPAGPVEEAAAAAGTAVATAVKGAEEAANGTHPELSSPPEPAGTPTTQHQALPAPRKDSSSPFAVVAANGGNPAKPQQGQQQQQQLGTPKPSPPLPLSRASSRVRSRQDEEAGGEQAGRHSRQPSTAGELGGEVAPGEEGLEGQGEEAVSVQFVVRESVQSVRLIMRVVQQHWLDRHGSIGAVRSSPAPSPEPPSSSSGLSPLQRASSSGSSGPAGLPKLGLNFASLAGAPPPPPGPLTSRRTSGTLPLLSAAAAPHHYRGSLATPRIVNTPRETLGATAAAAAGGPPSAGALHSRRGSTTGGGAAAAVGGSSSAAELASASSSSSSSVSAAAAAAAPVSGPPSTGAPASVAPTDASTPRVLSSEEVGALVAAARLMWEQLEELKSDVAKARLSLLKDAITGGGSGVQYERARFERALAGRPPSQALPKTLAWLQGALQAGGIAPGLRGQELVRALVASGLVTLLQRHTALSPADCPETLLLDCRGLVEMQSELQRICLMVAAGLIAAQVLAGRRVALAAGAQRELRATIKRRVGVLLSAGVNLEGLSVELHHQIRTAISEAAAADTAQPAVLAAPAASLPARNDGSGAASTNGGEERPGSAGREPGGPDATANGGISSSSSSRDDLLEVVRRMVRRIFATTDPVYQRVQAGVAAALSTLLLSSDSVGLDSCRRVLSGIGGEGVLEEVARLGSGLERIACLSVAVCLPFYLNMVAELEEERRGGEAGAGMAAAAAAGAGKAAATAAAASS